MVLFQGWRTALLLQLWFLPYFSLQREMGNTSQKVNEKWGGRVQGFGEGHLAKVLQLERVTIPRQAEVRNQASRTWDGHKDEQAVQRRAGIWQQILSIRQQGRLIRQAGALRATGLEQAMPGRQDNREGST